jgi:hypothetical protein
VVTDTLVVVAEVLVVAAAVTVRSTVVVAADLLSPPPQPATRRTKTRAGVARSTRGVYSALSADKLLRQELFEAVRIVERPDHGEIEATLFDQVARDALDLLGGDLVDLREDLFRVGRSAFEHLAP